MTIQQQALRAIECVMDTRLMSSSAAIRRDAPRLYAKWKDELVRTGTVATFARYAPDGMDALSMRLMEEVWALAHGRKYMHRETRVTFQDVTDGIDRRFPGYRETDGRVEPALSDEVAL